LAEKIWTAIDLVRWKSPIEEYEALSAKRVGDGAGNKEDFKASLLQVSFSGDSGESLAVMSGSELVGCHSDLFV
jgi:hypothetical protein